MTIKDALARSQIMPATDQALAKRVFEEARERYVRDMRVELLKNSGTFQLFEELIRELSGVHPDICGNRPELSQEHRDSYNALNKQLGNGNKPWDNNLPDRKVLIPDESGILHIGWGYVKENDEKSPFRTQYTYNGILAASFPGSDMIFITGEHVNPISPALWKGNRGKRVLEDTIVQAYKQPKRLQGVSPFR